MQNADVAREKLFNMRMSEDEWRRLDEVAKHYALNAAGLIRMLVKREHDAIAPTTTSEYAAKVLAYVDEKQRDAKAVAKATKKVTKRK